MKVAGSKAKIIGQVSDWIDEEEFFARKRKDPTLVRIEEKWSGGSSPILLVQAGHVEEGQYKECYWYQYPSEARCWECIYLDVCPKAVK